MVSEIWWAKVRCFFHCLFRLHRSAVEMWKPADPECPPFVIGVRCTDCGRVFYRRRRVNSED